MSSDVRVAGRERSVCPSNSMTMQNMSHEMEQLYVVTMQKHVSRNGTATSCKWKARARESWKGQCTWAKQSSCRLGTGTCTAPVNTSLILYVNYLMIWIWNICACNAIIETLSGHRKGRRSITTLVHYTSNCEYIFISTINKFCSCHIHHLEILR
jgi:hypothetical protein